jgi:hypothetical protein
MMNTRFHRLSIMCSALLVLCACFAPSRYMGINYAMGMAPQELQQLAKRAQRGDMGHDKADLRRQSCG